MEVEKTNILIIEDDKNFITWMKGLLSSLGEINIDEGHSQEDFHNLYEPGKYNLIVLDLRLDKEYEGMELLKHAMQEEPGAPIIIMTGYASVETAIDSLKLGAKDYLEKKYFKEDKDEFTREFMKKVNKIIIEDKIKKLLNKKQKEKLSSSPLIGDNVNIKNIIQFAELFAEKKTSPVFLIGEFGTEKEQIAEYIYKSSDARGKYIKKIIPSEDYDASDELFGKEDTPGLIDQARGGVLYLENIFNLKSENKSRLLDILNSGTYQGAKLNTQFILSTTPIAMENLSGDDVDKKLYYRVKTTPIVIPSLRERPEDIQIIAQYFLNALNKKGKINVTSFTQEVIDELAAYGWPGNVYELKHVVEAAALRAEIEKDQSIKMDHLMFGLKKEFLPSDESEAVNLDKILSEVFLKYMKTAIEKHEGTKTKAYSYLGYDKNQRGTLYSRIKKSFKTYPEFRQKYPELYELYKN
jgi:DNA-binding NtrC family response regulator